MPARSEVEAAFLTGRLTNAGGLPVPHARISWTTLEESFLQPWTGWDRQDWEAISHATVETRSSATGGFEFDGPPPGSEHLPSVAWITHASTVAQMVLVDPVATPIQLGSIALESAVPMTVRIVDAFGTPVAGALVEEYYSVPWDWRSDGFEPQAARVFHRFWTASEDGTAQVAPIKGEVLLQASNGELRSEAWVGRMRDQVTLTLSSTFEVSGSITYADGVEPEDDLRILCLAQSGGQRIVLTSISVDAKNRWGPVTLPLGNADGFHFRLEGLHIEVGHGYVEPPGAGEHITVNLEARAGMEQWFLLADKDSNALADGRVTVSWERNGLTTTSTRRARGDDGYMMFGDLPRGTVECIAECPGFATRDYGTMLLPVEPASSILIRLQPGGQLAGKVLSDDAVIEDFEITWWPTGNRADAHTVSFSAAEEGRFVLEDIPLQRVSVYASAAERAPSEIAEVQVTTETRAEVVLETATALRGRGRVVSAESGLPLQDAILQPYGTNQHMLIAPWGPPHRVEADGSFDITGFAAGQSRVRVSAPGYSSRMVGTIADTGTVVEFGSIALGGRQAIRIELLWDGDFDPTGYALYATGVQALAYRPFESDGGLTYEDASAGVYKAEILGPDDFDLSFTIICEPGEDWLFRIPIAGARVLRVEVLPETGAELPEEVWVTATLPSASGLPNRRTQKLGADGTVSFRGVLPGPYTVAAYFRGAPAAANGGTVRESDMETLVEVRLGAARQTLRSRDKRGAQLPDCWFLIFEPGTLSVRAGGITDEAGEFTLGLAPGEYLATLSHPTLGQRYDIPVTVGGGRNELIELVLDAPLHVEVQLLDGAQPQAGLQCRLFDLAGLNAVPGVTSDGQGLAHWDKFAEGRYTIRVRHPDYWPTEAEVPARADDLSTPVQVRHLGDLELKARSITSGLVSGLVIDLVSDEFETPVATWIQEGLVAAPSALLATGPDGVLRLTGLPHGTYSWHAQAPTGELLSGSVIVPPGELVRGSVTLP